MLPRCPILYTNRDRDSADCYHNGHQPFYEVSAVRHSLQRVEADVFRSFITSYIVYNEYYVDWDYSINGSCMTRKGVPVLLQTPYSYTLNADENQSEVQNSALSSFRSFLGLNGCNIGEISVAPGILLSTTLDDQRISFTSLGSTKSIIIASTGANVTSSPRLHDSNIAVYSSGPSISTNIASTVAEVTSSATTDRTTDLSQGQKAAIGTAIPVGGIALIVLTLFLWQRMKKQRAIKILGQTVPEETTRDNPPFLQIKPELQGEDSRHEMLAEDRIFELDGEKTRYEIMTEERSSRLNVQFQQQELRGEECALELDGCDTRAEI